LLEAHEDAVAFYSPDVCFEDAQRYIPDLASRRNFDPAVGLSLLDQISRIVEPVDRTLYEAYEELARARIASRDVEDWPVVAASLLLACPIWTEDQDISGVELLHGLPTKSNCTCAAHR
jgi:predicted nucleic acid-binding protein